MARTCAGLSAAASLLAPVPHALASDHVYAGTMTSPSWSMPHGFVIETRGRRISRMTMQWGAGCDSGYRVAFHGSLRTAARIGRTGRFRAVFSRPLDVGSTEVIAQATTTITGVLKRRAGAGRASARTVIAPVLTNPPTSGEPIEPDICDSGMLRWKVSRGAGVFGGATAQGEPVVARVRGRMVRAILIGWRADGCSGPGTWWDVADEVTNFELSGRGIFGDAFTYTEDGDDGGTTVYGYNVRGHLARKSMTGIFGVSPLVMDAGGNAVGGCTTPDIAWKARSA
jgi:hypothetical protein